MFAAPGEEGELALGLSSCRHSTGAIRWGGTEQERRGEEQAQEVLEMVAASYLVLSPWPGDLRGTSSVLAQ